MLLSNKYRLAYLLITKGYTFFKSYGLSGSEFNKKREDMEKRKVVRIGGEKEGEGSKGEMRVCCRKDGRWMKGRSGVEGVCMKA